MSSLTLTDDELVAIAIDHRTFWPGLLPTVDTESPASLEAASLRGYRSLLVRGFLGDNGRPNVALEELVGALPGRRNVVAIYFGDDDLARSGLGPSSTHVPVGREWVQESISPVGLHAFARRTWEEELDDLRVLLALAIESGPLEGEYSEGGLSPAHARVAAAEDAVPPTWLCLGTEAGDGSYVVAARRNELVWGERLGDGLMTTKAHEFTQEGVSVAVADLVAQCAVVG